jgi:hypothetical protein
MMAEYACIHQRLLKTFGTILGISCMVQSSLRAIYFFKSIQWIWNLSKLRLRADEMLWHHGSDFRLLERVIFHTLQHAKACLGAENIMKRWLVLFMLDSVPFPPRPLFLPQTPFVSHGLEYLFDFFSFSCL